MTKDQKQIAGVASAENSVRVDSQGDGQPVEAVRISRRERKLRERLLTIDEDLIHDEEQLRRHSDVRKDQLIKKINRARRKQEAKLDRREHSRLYHRCRPLYYAFTPFFAMGREVRSLFRRGYQRVEHHRATTPHRSFYLTTHAQAIRQINISGYGRFVCEVWRMIWVNRRFYAKLLLLVTILFLAVIGLDVQQSYIEMRDAILDVKLGWFLETVGLVTQAIITSVNVTDTNKRALAAVLVAMIWLVLIYAIRHIYGGKRQLKVRDVLYSAGGPFVSLLVLAVIILIQLLPLALAMIAYSAISGAGYINDGVAIENMAAWCAIGVLAIMTIYWMVTSLLSLITITIPGIYPMRAYFETSVLVSGRRVKILLRLLMMFLPVVVVWLIVLTPVVIMDARLKLANVSLVQLTTTTLVAATFIWLSVYLYMLYRRLIDSPEQPAELPPSGIIWPWRRRKHQTIAVAVDEAGRTNDKVNDKLKHPVKRLKLNKTNGRVS